MSYDWKTFTFGKGAHATRDAGMCLMEAVAYVAGEPHSDHPERASPAIAAFARGINDAITCDDMRRKLLSPFVFRLAGTKSPEHELTRAYMAADWAVRVAAPIALDACNLVEQAAKLRSLPEVKDKDSAHAAHAARAARASYASYASYAASAARAAARAARASYASYASYAASAARAAAHAAYASKRILFASAADLLDRMIRLTEPQEAVTSKCAVIIR